VLTVEPGLYFQPEDEMVPAELRGIGIRIEDDVVVTATGCKNLSDGLPRAADDVEAWLATQREAGRDSPDDGGARATPSPGHHRSATDTLIRSGGHSARVPTGPVSST
jgi:hypothetical protein